MKNERFITLILLGVMIITGIVIAIKPTRADSGWDSSYDSGGSYSSSSDISSPSSSSGRTNGGYLSDEVGITMFVMLWLVCGSILTAAVIKEYRMTHNYKKVYGGMSQQKIDKIDSSIIIDEMVKETFELCKKVQFAIRDLDYKTLEENLIEDMYKFQKVFAEVANNQKEKDIIDDMNLLAGAVKKVKIKNAKEYVIVDLKVEVKFHVINTETKEVIKEYNEPKKIFYSITLERDLDTSNNCSNCGSKLDSSSNRICSSCGASITRKSSKFVMSKKTVVD